MDRALAAFRRAAARENRERTGLRRRYSAATRQHAIAYWQQQRRRGVGVAGALGVAPWSLHRWIRAASAGADFRPVTVVATAPERGSMLTLRITADGPQLDGLDVESAVRLLRLWR